MRTSRFVLLLEPTRRGASSRQRSAGAEWLMPRR